MHLDVQDLRNFYYRNALGRGVRMHLRARVQQLWPDLTGQTLVGFGFATPVLRPYLSDARRVVALMPGPQGVMRWPQVGANNAVLCRETEWPLETGHVDRLILLHGLETSEHASDLLEEVWRVLGPGGKALFIVPNRAGLWSRRDATPFGYGRPYSIGQLETQLRKHQFLPERQLGALYQFPSHNRVWMKSAGLFERMGRMMPGVIAGGAFMLEASKRVYPPKGRLHRGRERTPIPVLEGIAKPVAGRVG
ncbi:MAG: methyltransferase domain-containing protein [Paracoccaceae bacterium]